MSGGAGARICSPDPSLAQLGEEVRLVEFELIHDGGDLEVLQRGGWTEVGEKRRVRGIATCGHAKQALAGCSLGGIHHPPGPSTNASATACCSIGLRPGA